MDLKLFQNFKNEIINSTIGYWIAMKAMIN